MIRTPEAIVDAQKRWIGPKNGKPDDFDYVVGVLAIAPTASEVRAAMKAGVCPPGLVLVNRHHSAISEWDVLANGEVLLRYQMREQPPHPAEITIIPLP